MKCMRTKRIFSCLLSVLIVAALFEFAVFAADKDTDSKGAEGQDLVTTKALNIKVKTPVTDLQYIKNGEMIPEFEAKGNDDSGLLVKSSKWTYVNEHGEFIDTEMFVPDGNYFLSVGIEVADGYKLPDKLVDIPITIDFDIAEDDILTADDYRTPNEFNPKQVGTYTIETIIGDNGIREIDIFYAAKPLPAVEKDITLIYTKPVAGDECMGDSAKYFVEANSADGVSAVGSLWERKIIGNIYAPAKKFEEGEQYRVTVMLYVKKGYVLADNLEDITVTLVDNFASEKVLSAKDFKLVEYMHNGDDMAYKFIYEFPEKLAALPSEEESEVVTSEVESESTTANEVVEETPNTGMASYALLPMLALAGAGIGIVSKKKK